MDFGAQLRKEAFDEVRNAFIRVPGRARSGVRVNEMREVLIFRFSGLLPKRAEVFRAFIIASLVAYLLSK